jgi:hypothetical protein
MTKEKVKDLKVARAVDSVSDVPVAEAVPTTNANGVPLGSVVPVPVASASRLLDIDRMALELARQQRATALAEARTALAQNEKAELAYKYVVLQLYMKYGLTDADAISETGDIIKGGALPQQPKQ